MTDTITAPDGAIFALLAIDDGEPTRGERDPGGVANQGRPGCSAVRAPQDWRRREESGNRRPRQGSRIQVQTRNASAADQTAITNGPYPDNRMP